MRSHIYICTGFPSMSKNIADLPYTGAAGSASSNVMEELNQMMKRWMILICWSLIMNRHQHPSPWAARVIKSWPWHTPRQLCMLINYFLLPSLNQNAWRVSMLSNTREQLMRKRNVVKRKEHKVMQLTTNTNYGHAWRRACIPASALASHQSLCLPVT